MQVRSSISPAGVQTVPFPPLPAGATPAASNYSIRLLTSSPSSKPSLFVIRMPIDRAAATARGGAIGRVYMKSWGDQIDELVVVKSYLDALSLLDTIIDVVVIPDKVEGVFILTSSILTSCRLNVMLSFDHCMRSPYSRTGSTTKQSIYSSNSIRIHQRSSRFTLSLSPAGFLSLRRTGLSCLAAQGRRHQPSLSLSPRKGQRRRRNRRRLKAGIHRLRLRCQLFQHRVLLLRSKVIFQT